MIKAGTERIRDAGLVAALRQDLARYPVRGALRTLFLVLTTTEIQIVFLYRVAHASFAAGFLPLARILRYVQMIVFASDLHYAAKIGPGLRLKHGMNVVVGEGVEIGRFATIFNGVTLGTREILGTTYPRAGDYLFAGTGAKILGGIILGSRVAVGANSVLLRDVPDNTMVAGVPACAIGVTPEADVLP